MYSLFIMSILVLIIYGLTSGNRFSNNFMEHFTYNQMNEKIPTQIQNLEDALSNIESRIPYFTGISVTTGDTSNIALRGTSLNNIIIDMTLKPAPVGNQGQLGLQGPSGSSGSVGDDGKQGLMGYWF
jgi:hypothetical protein